MAYEATGILHHIGPTEQKSERFTKREFVLLIADNPKYPQHVQFQATGDRCKLLDSLQEGDDVAVEFSLRGREWRGPNGVKWFTTLDVFRIDARRTSPRPGGAHEPAPTKPDSDGDIPF